MISVYGRIDCEMTGKDRQHRLLLVPVKKQYDLSVKNTGVVGGDFNFAIDMQ